MPPSAGWPGIPGRRTVELRTALIKGILPRLRDQQVPADAWGIQRIKPKIITPLRFDHCRTAPAAQSVHQRLMMAALCPQRSRGFIGVSSALRGRPRQAYCSLRATELGAHLIDCCYRSASASGGSGARAAPHSGSAPSRGQALIGRRTPSLSKGITGELVAAQLRGIGWHGHFFKSAGKSTDLCSLHNVFTEGVFWLTAGSSRSPRPWHGSPSPANRPGRDFLLAGRRRFAPRQPG